MGNLKYEVIEIDNKEVTFDISELATNKNLYVNATEIGKHFNKRPADWLRGSDTKEYVKAVSRYADLRNEDLVTTKQGGKHQGTWLHSKLIIAYARWLNPVFAVKCDNKIQEMLQNQTQVQTQQNDILPAIVEMAKVNQQIVKSNQELISNITEMNKGLHQMLAGFANMQQDIKVMKKKVDCDLVGSMNIWGTQINKIRERQDGLNPLHLDTIRDYINIRAKELYDGTDTNYQSITRAIYSYINSEFGVSSYYHINYSQLEDALALIKNIDIKA